MFFYLWLLSTAMAAWASREIVGNGSSKGIDVILGILCAALLRYVFLLVQPAPDPVYILLFSVWAAAAPPAAMRLFVVRRVKLASSRLKRVTSSLP